MATAVHSRPDKLDDAETALFEIDMLRFAKDRLLSAGASPTEADEWAYLEAFLLHYRNLIEFFGHGNPRADDLNITKPNDIWPSKPPDNATLASLKRPDLWKKYEGSDESISRYLHHCTKQRGIKKKWNIAAMYEDLRPTIEKFTTLLPEYKPATKAAAAPPATAATATLAPGEKPTPSGPAPSTTIKQTPQ